MPIKLTWENINASNRELRVYRNDGPNISIETKGTSLVTLPGDAKTWTDPSTELGKEYSYLIEVKLGNDIAYSRPTSTVDLMRRGPGSFSLIQGDARLGYMGTVQIYELPNVVDAYGLSKYNAQYQTYQKWHKFIRKGKIYYVLDSPLSENFQATTACLNGSWLALNDGVASGIQFGFDTSGANWANSRKTKIVETNGFRYHLRAARAFPDNWDGSFANLDLTLLENTEFNELIQPVIPGMQILNRVGSWGVVKSTVVFKDIVAAESMNGASPLSLVKAFSFRQNNVLPEWGAKCATANYPWNSYKEVSGGSNQYCVHIPILELIEE